MYGIGALLTIIGLMLRFELPESPRWLITRGRLTEAERVVVVMEEKASARVLSLPPVADELPVIANTTGIAYAEIFNTALYLKRTILLLVVWLVAYITVYAIGTGLTSLLAGLYYPPPEAGLIAAIGTVGFILAAIVAYMFGESLERKSWLPIAAVLTLLGGIMIALGGKNLGITAFGSIILFFGFNLWVPMTYTWSTENYPTRARATGFALVDGVGHIGGGIGLILIASLISSLGPLFTFILIGGFLLIAACLAQFGLPTKHKRLDEVSP
jgi:MFS family permease